MCGRLHRGCRVGGSPDLCGLAGVIVVSVTPSVGPEPGDLERETGERLLDAMPVGMAPLVEHVLIVALERLPARGGRADLKRTESIGANQRCGQQRYVHMGFPGPRETLIIPVFALARGTISRPLHSPCTNPHRNARRAPRHTPGSSRAFAIRSMASVALSMDW